MPTLGQRVDKHDRDITAIKKLILAGMKMIVKGQEEMRDLRASQRETDRLLKAFIRSLNGGNGHVKRHVD